MHFPMSDPTSFILEESSSSQTSWVIYCRNWNCPNRYQDGERFSQVYWVFVMGSSASKPVFGFDGVAWNSPQLLYLKTVSISYTLFSYPLTERMPNARSTLPLHFSRRFMLYRLNELTSGRARPQAESVLSRESCMGCPLVICTVCVLGRAL